MTIGTENVFAARENVNLDKVKAYQNQNLRSMDDKKVKAVAEDFESIFVEQLFKSMRQTVSKSGWLDGGLRQDVFDDMLYGEYSKLISRSGGIGLKDTIYQALKNK